MPSRLVRGGFLLLLSACAGERASSPRPPVKDAAPVATADPGPRAAAVVDAPALLREARNALDQGDHARARLLLAQAATVPSPRGAAAVMAAESHLQDDGDLKAAQDDLQAALALAPDDTEALLLMARVKEAQGLPLEAQALYLRVAAARPRDGTVPERLASVSLTLATQAQLSRDDVTLRSAAGQALEAFGKARALAGDKPAYSAGEARAHELLGDLVAAETSLRHLQELSPGAAGPHVMLVDFFERHHQAGKADKERKAAGTEATPQKRKLRPLQPSR
jgi:tetratricopeptide (TPR) repeat protein